MMKTIGNNYTILHIHDMLSNAITNIDSVTKFDDYAKKAKDCGMNAIASSNHGSVMNWYHKKQVVEELGMKFIHAEEFYITATLNEKIRDNYHCLLIAKNYDGFLELNTLSSKSFNREDNSFYYVPRISYDDLKSTSDNIIVSTACLGGILNKADKDMKNDFAKWLRRNKHRCFLELQPHLDSDQIAYNKKLYEVHQKTKIPLIMCTDTHSLNKQHVEARQILQKAKNIHFDGEDKFHLEFLNYDELVSLCKRQGALPMEVYLEAIENTNKVADMVEPFEIDYSYKYPHLWGDDSEKLFKQKIKDGLRMRGVDKFPNYKEYIERIRYELKAYEHNQAIDFMLLMADIIDWCKTQDIQVGYGRGSCNGSVIAWLLGITEMDSIKHKLNFDRFMNVERVSLSDIDTDFPPSRINEVKDYIFHRHGLYCSDIVAFNTIALKGAIRDVSRALEISLDEVNDICDKVDMQEDALREQYAELFRYVDMVNGCVVSVGNHPCGLVCSPYSIIDRLGTFTTSTDTVPISQINMKEIDAMNYVKLDLLKLDTADLINETCKLAKIKRLTPDNIDITDVKVWDSIRDDTTAIFQWEGSTGDDYIKKLLSDKNIAKLQKVDKNVDRMTLLSIGNSAIRPAGASYRDDLANGVVRSSGSKAIDDFLKPTFGYLCFQEQIIQFLHEYCGYTMGEADVVRRHFAKKYGTEDDIPKIKAGFIATMKEKYNMDKSEAEQTIVAFLQVIMDASRYLFSLNHSQPYSYEGYVSGWLRYYYPLEFLTVALNINTDKEEKTKALTNYAHKNSISILPPKFGYSTDVYAFDKKTNSIYKGIASIKNLNAKCGVELYALKDNHYNDFFELLTDVKQTTINSRQLDILIRIDFFARYGDMNSLLKIVELFNKYSSCKQIKKDKLNDAEIKIVRECSQKESDKMFKDIDNKKLIKLLFDQSNITPSTIFDKIHYQIQLLGYTNLIAPCDDDIYAVQAIELNQWGTPFVTLYQVNSGVTAQYKADKRYYSDHPIEMGDIIDAAIREKDKKRKSDNGWETVGSEEVLVAWSKEI